MALDIRMDTCIHISHSIKTAGLSHLWEVTRVMGEKRLLTAITPNITVVKISLVALSIFFPFFAYDALSFLDAFFFSYSSYESNAIASFLHFSFFLFFFVDAHDLGSKAQPVIQPPITSRPTPWTSTLSKTPSANSNPSGISRPLTGCCTFFSLFPTRYHHQAYVDPLCFGAFSSLPRSLSFEETQPGILFSFRMQQDLWAPTLLLVRCPFIFFFLFLSHWVR